MGPLESLEISGTRRADTWLTSRTVDPRTTQTKVSKYLSTSLGAASRERLLWSVLFVFETALYKAKPEDSPEV